MGLKRMIAVLAVALTMAAAVPLAAALGDCVEVGEGGWSAHTIATALDGYLWIIDGGGIYRVSTK